MVSLETAFQLIEESINVKSRTIMLPADKAANDILARDVYAPISIPNFPKAAMDGYAVRAKETRGACSEMPVRLSVAGEICAGENKRLKSKSMDAVRIMTGASVPEGYDSVVRQEDTDLGEKEVLIYKEVKEYTNYCKVGEDIEQGQSVIRKHTRLNSFHVGILAGLGISSIEVMEPIKAGIICTGSELLQINEIYMPGMVYDSVGYMIASRIESKGFNVCFHEICPDNMDKLTALIQSRIEEVDILITTGGISVGKKDYMPCALERLQARKILKGIEIQPGTPTMLYLYKDKPILCLSGNPYAAITHFEFLFWRIASAAMNNLSYRMKQDKAVLKSEYHKINKLRRLVRAYAENGEVTIPSEKHQSSVFGNMPECNCFIDLPAGTEPSVNDTVSIWRMNL